MKEWFFYDSNGTRRKVKQPYFYDSNGTRRKVKAGYFYDSNGNRRQFYQSVPGPNFQLTAGLDANEVGFLNGGLIGVAVPPLPAVPPDGSTPGNLYDLYTFADATTGFTLTYSTPTFYAPPNSFLAIQVWNAAGTTLLHSLNALDASYTANLFFTQWLWASSTFKLINGTIYQIRFT